ncbi:hypothetical protein HWV62_38328 [Athelia sp. TMB]|nr:hypothetical protein HWV62_38328 [Athelia sp. TMB]
MSQRLSRRAAVSTLYTKANQWDFPNLHGPYPRVQHQEPMTGPQGNYNQGPHIHPSQYTTPEHSRPPFTPLPYINPLHQTLSMPPGTPLNYTPNCEDTSYANLTFHEAMERDQRMNDERQRANPKRANPEHPERAERARNARGGHTHAEHDENTSECAANRGPRTDDLAKDTVPQPKPASKKKTVAGRDVEKDLAKTKKSGTGARSGALNRRIAGGSDAEIKELDVKEAEGAAVTPHSTAWTEAEKLQVISYVTLEKVWKDWKVNKAKELLNISQKLFGGKHDGKAVDNLWSRFWAMFKIVRRCQEHIGGGDGDEDDGTDLEGDGGGEGESVKKRKISAKRVRFSKSVLDTFEKSVYFRALDKVYVILFDASEAQHIYSTVSSAHSHVEIVRPRAFNSALEISDGEDTKPVRGRKKAKLNSDDEDESGGALKSLMETLWGCNTTRDRVDTERLQNDCDTLALAQRKEDR